MGGRGAAQHSSAMAFGRHMDFTGYYAPTDIDEAERWHMANGTFDPDVWHSLTEAQRDAIESYTGSAYHAMNDALFGTSTPSAATQELIRNATEGMNVMKSPGNFVVWRGDRLSDIASLLGGTVAQMSDARFLSKAIGSTVNFKGFMSSAITEDAAWTFKGVTSIIKVPSGTAGFYVDPVSANSGEKEFLFAPGTKMRVHHIKRGPGGALDTIEFEVIKQK